MAIATFKSGQADLDAEMAQVVDEANAAEARLAEIETRQMEMDEAVQACSPISHNGTFTVVNKAKGTHRTFKIKRQASDADFMPGKRILSVLTGGNDWSSYKSIGFLYDNQDAVGVRVWNKLKGTQWAVLAKFVEKMDRFIETGKVEVQWSATCRRCNRPLTNPESLAAGIGPECRKALGM